MAELASSTLFAASAAAGLTVFGVSTGLQPAILLAGLAGGLWASTYSSPASPIKRAAVTVLSAVLSGYLTPSFAAALTSFSGWPEAVTCDLAKLPIAVVIGLLAHRVLGPALLKFAQKKAEEVSQ